MAKPRRGAESKLALLPRNQIQKGTRNEAGPFCILAFGQTYERYSEVELHRLRGDLLNATGDRSAAEPKYHQALAVAKRQDTRLFELRASMSLARLWRDQGKTVEARELLAPVYGWFTEGFDTRDLKEA
jgi:predicted ATPase